MDEIIWQDFQRQMIQEVLELHLKIVYSGGKKPYSYSLLNSRQRRVVSMFKLPFTEEIVRMTVTCPFFCPNPPLLNDALCKNPEMFGVQPSKPIANPMQIMLKAGKQTLMDSQVEFIHRNLSNAVKQYSKPKF